MRVYCLVNFNTVQRDLAAAQENFPFFFLNDVDISLMLSADGDKISMHAPWINSQKTKIFKTYPKLRIIIAVRQKLFGHCNFICLAREQQ